MPKQTINWEKKAAVAWPILCQAAQERETLSYRQLADRLGMHHRPIKYLLDVIYQYCSTEGLPALSGIVVRQDTGTPGDGFREWKDIGSGLDLVYEHNWQQMENPFSGFLSGDSTIESLADDIIKTPTKAGDIWSLVKSRGIAQQIFRRALLQIYDYRCAMCEITFEECLEAAHIVSWANCNDDQKLDPTNGLLLCANHHRLFDCGWFKIESDYTIVFSDPNKHEGPYSPADEAMSIAIHKNKLRVPNDTNFWPMLTRNI